MDVKGILESEGRTVAAWTNLLAKVVGTTEGNSGFREDWEMAARLEEIADGGATDADVIRDDLHRAANMLRVNIIGTKLMLVASELGEALESLRDTGYEGLVNGEGNFHEELADAHIRLHGLHQLITQSPFIGDEIVRKAEKNADRPYKHGRKI